MPAGDMNLASDFSEKLAYEMSSKYKHEDYFNHESFKQNVAGALVSTCEKMMAREKKFKT